MTPHGQIAVPGALMRGGTSKGLVFNADDLPADPAVRDALLLAAMGSPDARQIDGLGGAHPLTSKVAVVGRTSRDGIDVDYLFLQVRPDRPEVSDHQNCGNMLAAVGPFAIETGLVAARDGITPVRIWMANTGTVAVAHVPTPGGVVTYAGDAAIDGVPGTHAPILIEFTGTVGSSTGALLPTGNARDRIAGLEATCIDNGMPVVCLRAADLGLTGNETPARIEADSHVSAAVERVRLAAGPLMNLGDVSNTTVPKVSLLSPPRNGGSVATRTFIPHRVHEAIGVLGAISVATACLVPGSVAADIDPDIATDRHHVDLKVEHPTGFFTVGIDLAAPGSGAVVERVALLRTARMLMRGDVLVPAAVFTSGRSAQEQT